MLECVMLEADPQHRVQRLLSGDCRIEDLDRIFLGLRSRRDSRDSMREIRDSHRDEREKGPATQRVRDLAASKLHDLHLLLRHFDPNQPFRTREEFRMPLGVRKSARNEPAVCGPRLMGI